MYVYTFNYSIATVFKISFNSFAANRKSGEMVLFMLDCNSLHGKSERKNAKRNEFDDDLSSAFLTFRDVKLLDISPECYQRFENKDSQTKRRFKRT